MPIAVMMESSENTISMMMIWTMIQKNALWFRRSAFSRFMRFHLAMNLMRRLGDQEQAAADQDDVAPRKFKTRHREHRRGQANQPDQNTQQQNAEDQRQRQTDLARTLRLRGGIRETITDRKMTLSIPSTISSAVSVNSAAHASGLVSSSIIGFFASEHGSRHRRR